MRHWPPGLEFMGEMITLPKPLHTHEILESMERHIRGRFNGGNPE